jgi:hypothetical protein
LRKKYTCLKDDTVDDNDSGANYQSYGHHGIFSAGFIEVFGKSPRGCVGVIGLHCRTAPGSIAVGVGKHFAIATHNGDHDCVVDESAEDRAPDLSSEHDARWDFDYFDESASIQGDID